MRVRIYKFIRRSENNYRTELEFCHQFLFLLASTERWSNANAVAYSWVIPAKIAKQNAAEYFLA